MKNRGICHESLDGASKGDKMKDLYYKLYRINKDKTESLIMESPAIKRLKIEIDFHYEDSDTYIKDVDGNVVYEQKAKR